MTEVFAYLAEMFLEKRRSEEQAARRAAPKTSNFEESSGGNNVGGSAVSGPSKPNFQQPSTGAGIRLDKPSKQRATQKKGFFAACTLL